MNGCHSRFKNPISERHTIRKKGIVHKVRERSFLNPVGGIQMTNSRKLVNFIIVLIITKNISEIARKASESQKKDLVYFSKYRNSQKLIQQFFQKLLIDEN